MEVSWAKVSPLLVALFLVGLMSVVGFMSWKGEQDFRKKCDTVSGRILVDSDGDVECYRNGIEIAEYGENTPK